MLASFLGALLAGAPAPPSPPVPEPPPVAEIEAEPAVQAKNQLQIAVHLSFAPDGKTLALVLQDYRGIVPQKTRRLIIVPLDTRLPRTLWTSESYRDVFWSPDASALAYQGDAWIRFFQLPSGQSCELAVPPARPGAPAGFAEGPLFVFHRRGADSAGLEFFTPACQLAGTALPPPGWAARVLPNGKYILFRAEGEYLLSDAHGGMAFSQPFDFNTPPGPALRRDPAQIELLSGTFGEQGKVVCTAAPTREQPWGGACFDVFSGKRIAMLPHPEHYGPPVGLAQSAPRAVCPEPILPQINPAKEAALRTAYALAAAGSRPDAALQAGFGPVMPYVKGWIVWDYSRSAVLLRLPPKSQSKLVEFERSLDQSVAISPLGDLLAVATNNTIRLYAIPDSPRGDKER
jgi:hypothetical protein